MIHTQFCFDKKKVTISQRHFDFKIKILIQGGSLIHNSKTLSKSILLAKAMRKTEI